MGHFRSIRDVLAAISLVNGRLVARERRTATYHRNVLAGIATGVITLDERGRVGSFNRAAARILETDSEIFLGRSVVDVPPLAPFASALRLAQSKGVREQGEIKVDSRIVAFQTLPLLAAASQSPLGAQLLIDDVTERRRLEKVATVQSKMEALGRFSGFIVHDVGNINSEMDGVMARLRGRTSADPEVAEALQDLRARIGRIHELVRTQREFVRGKAPERKPVDLREVVLGALGSVRRAAGVVVQRGAVGGGTSGVRGPPTAPPRRRKSGAQRRASHGRQWHAESGSVAGRRRRRGRGSVGYRTRHSPGAARRSLRTPHFVPSGRPGAGAALVLQSVTAHGGTVHVESDPRVGTTFQLRLPVAPAEGEST